MNTIDIGSQSVQSPYEGGGLQRSCCPFLLVLKEWAGDPLRATRCFACNGVWLCAAECRRRLYFTTSPYPHLEVNKDGTSYLIGCSPPMPRCYGPELLVEPARAVPSSAAAEYRAACTVHSAALCATATPAFPAAPGRTSGGVPTAPGPTPCIQQLRCTPRVVVVELAASHRIVAMPLEPPVPAAPVKWRW